MKKVLIFSYSYFPHVGGAEIAIKEITDRISDCQFDLITFNLGGQPKTERMGNINIYRISGFTKYLYPFKSFLIGLVLHKKKTYDCLWSMMANTGFMSLGFKILFSKINYVLTIQEGDPIPQMKRRVWFVYPIYGMVFSWADRVTAISSYLADFARSMGAKKVEIIPNGVDQKKFKHKNEKLKINATGKIVLITTGRLVKKNAVEDIIKALNFLPENIFFRSVGSGEDEGVLKKVVEKLGLKNRVEFLPHASHEKMAELLASADIFIRPSLSEGLGNSFLEAMAVGVPIIGTRVGGIPDFLNDGDTGLYCEIKNPNSVAEKVKLLIQDPALYEKISRHGAELVHEKYNWDIIADKFRTIFAL